jgi:hypothetical protein
MDVDKAETLAGVVGSSALWAWTWPPIRPGT